MQNQATHASWKGAITFGMVSVPVKLYTATEERKVSFHQVHEACGVRTRSQTVCPSCDRTIDRAEIVKGYEEGGELTIVTDADLEGLPLRSTRNIDVLAFVPADSVPLLMLDKGYYVGPSDDSGQKAFALLRDAMGENVAVAKIGRSGREAVCVIRSHGRVMVLHHLSWADEVRATGSIEASLMDVEISDEERELAQQLVAALSQADGSIIEAQEDGYRAALLSIIEAKREGREPLQMPTPEKKAGGDLMAALKASVAAASEKAA